MVAIRVSGLQQYVYLCQVRIVFVLHELRCQYPLSLHFQMGGSISLQKPVISKTLKKVYFSSIVILHPRESVRLDMDIPYGLPQSLQNQ